MKEQFLNFLCCPNCNSDLNLITYEKVINKIKKGRLICKNKKCKLQFKVENYIPRFVEFSHYANSFGDQWKKFAKTQIDNNSLKESTLRWDSEIGWGKNDLRNKSIIEFGSGAGRFIDIASRREAQIAVGIDVTFAVDAAQDTFKDRNNVFFIQADIFNPPVKRDYFDFGYSIGVLHHTPNPELAFEILLSLINKNGNVGISLYEICLFNRPSRNSLKQSTLELFWAINLWRVEFFRFFTTKIPDRIFLAYCLYFVPILHYLNKIPVLRFFRYFFPSTCYRELPVEWSMCDTNDTYSTKIVHMYRHKDIFQWFMKANVQNIIVHNSIPGWVSLTGSVTSMNEISYQKYIFDYPKLGN